MKTKNDYIVIEVLEDNFQKEKLTGKSLEVYKSIVIEDSTGEYKAGEQILVTKGGLLTVDLKKNTFAISKTRVVLVF